ncbi:hypothetical protein IGJ19_000425 [Enterococcus sp. DIV1368b]|uniref:Uncharacterized protein n=1 Tax=Enterococcus mundtii TaxID=53346 RepID=A0A242KWH4_ENTMU|nr:hypothetical protein A5802_002737 [Enterococcus mundtii]
MISADVAVSDFYVKIEERFRKNENNDIEHT